MRGQIFFFFALRQRSRDGATFRVAFGLCQDGVVEREEVERTKTPKLGAACHINHRDVADG